MKKLAFVFVLLTVVLSACKREPTRPQAEIDEEIIVNYIQTNALDATPTGSGLYVVINNPGTGQQPTANSDVTVAYSGYFTNGQTFDQSGAQGITFNLQQVIKGWTEGIPHFKKGGSGVLLIPSALGYGSQGAGAIPPNSVIIFNVTLVDVL